MIEYQQFTLDNGLRVVHSHDPQTAMVAVNVLYNVGARDEVPEHTGMAHLFEHLMFGGSINIPDFDGELEAAGGQNNAFTSSDFTNFFDVVPAQNVETAFHLESDRMLSLAFSDKALKVQRNVVIEEFKQVCLNRPYGTLSHHLRALLYPSHPYSWPVIGLTPEHIAEVTQPMVRDWFFSHYAPNNAILSVVGNITFDRVKELATKWFGDIPRRDVHVRDLADDPWLTQQAYKHVTENVPQPCVCIAWRMAPYGADGYLAADAISDILAAGKSSRLYRNLVMSTDLFASADASIAGLEHSGYLQMRAFLNRDDAESVARAITMMQTQATDLATPGNISEYELQRTKNRYESTFTFENMSIISKAQNLGMAVYHGEDINATVARYQALTTADLCATARQLFIDHQPAVLVISK